MKQLKRLTLDLQYKDKKESKKEINSLFSFNAFEGINGLTHLSINFPYYSTIDERVLTNIDINLPNLQLLRINSQIKTDLNGYEVITDRLSRLSNLQTIDIDVRKKSIEEMFKTKLIKNCPKIFILSDESDGSVYSDSDSN